MDFNALMREFLEEMEEKDNNEYEVVGKVSEELVRKFAENKRLIDIETEIINKKKELYFAQLKKEHDIVAFVQAKKDLWAEAYKELGLTTEKEMKKAYHLDPVTHEVLLKVNTPEKDKLLAAFKNATSIIQ